MFDDPATEPFRRSTKGSRGFLVLVAFLAGVLAGFLFAHTAPHDWTRPSWERAAGSAAYEQCLREAIATPDGCRRLVGP